MTYKNLKHEFPLRDTVGLCVTAHQIVHLEIFWKTPLKKVVNWYLRVAMVVIVPTAFVLRREANWFLKAGLVAIATISFIYVINEHSSTRKKYISMNEHKQNSQPKHNPLRKKVSRRDQTRAS
ncbi:MAG: hypothetical protein PUP93_20420 [Rhizonema sp. NSF051]|nr:hypothetical protein [Rhizonema sp. NSF051]